jgi:Type II CAAX prenyl endopeptidase Rce1-like
MRTPAPARKGPPVTNHPLRLFATAVIGFYGLLWGTQLLFRGNIILDATIVVATTMAGIVVARPGWNMGWQGGFGYPSLLIALLVGSAAIAAVSLVLLKVPLPYALSNLNWIALLLGIVPITGLEELLFRQVMYRWLEKQHLSNRVVVGATAIAWGCAHLGLVFTASSSYRVFHILQSVFLILVGILLGELRRTTGSWPASWVGHAAYNLAVSFILSVI